MLFRGKFTHNETLLNESTSEVLKRMFYRILLMRIDWLGSKGIYSIYFFT